MYESYISPEIEVDEELLVKKSRFIGCVRMLEKEGDFSGVLQRIKKSYPSATHYCWAFRVGLNCVIEHSNDDGEPTGTAGRPILSAMKRADLSQTLVCVVRYYGGVKLGVSGLIEAYGCAATKAVDSSHPKVQQRKAEIQVRTDYQTHPVIIRNLKAIGVLDNEISASFGEKIELLASIPLGQKASLAEELSRLKNRGRNVAFEWRE